LRLFGRFGVEKRLRFCEKDTETRCRTSISQRNNRAVDRCGALASDPRESRPGCEFSLRKGVVLRKLKGGQH